MNGKSAAGAADFSFYKRNESSLSDSFYKKKNYQTEGLVGFSLLKTEPIGKGAANPLVSDSFSKKKFTKMKVLNFLFSEQILVGNIQPFHFYK